MEEVWIGSYLLMQFLGQTSIRREVSPYEERHIPTMLEGGVNCASPVTLLQPSCNSIPKLGLCLLKGYLGQEVQ